MTSIPKSSRATALLFLVIVFLGQNSYANHKHSDAESMLSKLQDLTFGSKQESPKKPSEPVYYTFLASGRNILGDSIGGIVSPKLSMFYKTPTSDLNSQSTEVISHNENPNWMTVLKFMWKDSPSQELQFKVKSVDSKEHELPLGEVKINMETFASSMDENKEVVLTIPRSHSQIILKKTEVLTFKLYATKLAKKDTWGGKSDPYVICYWRQGPDGPEVEFFRTSWIGNVVDAEWMEDISFPGYLKGSDQYFHFKVYDDDQFTSDDFLGEAYLRIDDSLLPGSPSRRVLELINEPEKSGPKGTLIVTFN